MVTSHKEPVLCYMCFIVTVKICPAMTNLISPVCNLHRANYSSLTDSPCRKTGQSLIKTLYWNYLFLTTPVYHSGESTGIKC